MFLVDGYKINSTSISNHIKLFEEKMGKNKPLKVDVEFQSIKVSFGKLDADIVIDYVMCLNFRLDLLGAKELMYDCL